MRLSKLLLFVAAVSTDVLLSSARAEEEEGTQRDLGLAPSCIREDMAKSNFDISFLSETTR